MNLCRSIRPKYDPICRLVFDIFALYVNLFTVNQGGAEAAPDPDIAPQPAANKIGVIQQLAALGIDQIQDCIVGAALLQG